MGDRSRYGGRWSPFRAVVRPPALPALLLATLSLAAGALVTLGATIIVDDDGSTPDLQVALDSAVAGDRVLVLPGTYVGQFVVPVDVELVGSGAESTTLDGNGLGTTVTVTGGMLAGNLVRGFTITGGSDSGLVFNFARGTIEDNIIEGNTATLGGGARLSGCPMTFRDNVVRNNQAITYGGGVYVDVSSACSGGWTSGTVAVRLTNNIMHGNSAGAGAVFVESYLGDPGPPDEMTGRVTSNVIAGNPGGGLMVACDYFGDCGGAYPEGYPEVADNLFHDNGPFDISDGLVSVSMNGNSTGDPLFVDAGNGDFRLDPASPAVETAAVLSLFPVAEDRDGFQRPVDGDLDSLALPDRGAFEELGQVSDLELATGGNLAWAARSGAAVYHLYRGDLPTLLAGGDYTQDPLSGPQARRWCDLASAAFTDSEDPAVDAPFFYLVTPADASEGSLGHNAARQPRFNAHPCP